MTARTTRRALFGASAATLALIGTAGPSSATGLDGRLLALAAELDAVQAAIEANSAESRDATQERQHELDALLDDLQLDRFWPVADEIAATPARTLEGVKAKAKAARIVWRAVDPDEDSHLARQVFGLVRDLLGEG